MWDKAEYHTTWCDDEAEMPQIDTMCPKCQNGMVAMSQFTKGEKYCRECKWKWKISKFPKKKKEEISEDEEPKYVKDVFDMEAIKVLLEEIKPKLNDIWEYVEGVKKRLQKR